MKRLRAIKQAKYRREYLKKLETRESRVLTTISAMQTDCGKITENLNSKLNYVRSKIFKRTEV